MNNNQQPSENDARQEKAGKAGRLSKRPLVSTAFDYNAQTGEQSVASVYAIKGVTPPDDLVVIITRERFVNGRWMPLDIPPVEVKINDLYILYHMIERVLVSPRCACRLQYFI